MACTIDDTLGIVFLKKKNSARVELSIFVGYFEIDVITQMSLCRRIRKLEQHYVLLLCSSTLKKVHSVLLQNAQGSAKILK